MTARRAGSPEATGLLERSSRLDCGGVELVRLHRVAVPLRSPLRASHGTETVRRSTLVEVRDATGATGWGECPALTHPTYTGEYASGAWRLLRDELVPAALAGRGGSVRGHPMARFALECALADLRLRLAGCSLGDALAGAVGTGAAPEGAGEPDPGGAPAVGSGRRHRIARTVVVGRRIDGESPVASSPVWSLPAGSSASAPAGCPASSSTAEAIRAVDAVVDAVVDDAGRAVAGGARLVKVKIEPGWDREPLAALRAAFPTLPLAADANGAYAGHGPDALDWVEELGLDYLEQPLDPEDLVGHARLQARLAATPLALDETVTSVGLLAAAVALRAGRRFSLKPSRLGGLLAPARAAAATPGCFVGGMFELGVGRAAAMALASLDVVDLPCDLGPSEHYVELDVTEPLVVDEAGDLVVPDGPGIGVEVRTAWVAALADEVVELRP